MRKLLLALSLIAFSVGPALAEFPGDPDNGGGNDPPKQTPGGGGGGGGGQKGGPGPEGNSGP